MVTWKRLNTETTQLRNRSKIIYEEFSFFFEIRGNPLEVQNCGGISVCTTLMEMIKKSTVTLLPTAQHILVVRAHSIFSKIQNHVSGLYVIKQERVIQ